MRTVSVVMAVHNGERHLSEALDSVLGQTYRDLEVIVVDDGSEDGTAGLLSRYRDPRLVVVRHLQNQGLSASLNDGIEAARGAYIARMDADDVSEPRRIERQVELMEARPDLGIAGTACAIIGEGGGVVGSYEVPETDLEIRWRALLSNPFAHPTVMLRREVMASRGLRYDPTFEATQDYELWSRLLPHTRAANIPEPLLRYRAAGGVTERRRAEQLRNQNRVAVRMVAELAPELVLGEDEVQELRGLVLGAPAAASTPPARRLRHAELQLALLEAFARRHAGTEGLSDLRHREVLVAGRMALGPPRAPGWPRVVRRMLAVYPALPLELLVRAPRSGARRALARVRSTPAPGGTRQNGGQEPRG